jgi:hypothetical protein
MEQEGATEILRDPGRLAALHENALVHSRTDEAFDRLTRIAAKGGAHAGSDERPAGSRGVPSS